MTNSFSIKSYDKVRTIISQYYNDCSQSYPSTFYLKTRAHYQLIQYLLCNYNFF